MFMRDTFAQKILLQANMHVLFQLIFQFYLYKNWLKFYLFQPKNPQIAEHSGLLPSGASAAVADCRLLKVLYLVREAQVFDYF